MVQTAVRLPQSLRDRLSKAGGERGMGEEIRRRLEASFEAEKAPADPKTRELLDAISSCAEEIARGLRKLVGGPLRLRGAEGVRQHAVDALPTGGRTGSAAQTRRHGRSHIRPGLFTNAGRGKSGVYALDKVRSASVEIRRNVDEEVIFASALLATGPSSSSCAIQRPASGGANGINSRGTKRKAQDECARLISELNGGLYIEPAKITVGQFLDRWLEHIKPLVSPRTHERYGELVTKNIKPLLGAVLLTKLRPMQISDAYAKALSSGRRKGKGGLAPEHGALHARHPEGVHAAGGALANAGSQSGRCGRSSQDRAQRHDAPTISRRPQT